jgi:hypothetical protein
MTKRNGRVKLKRIPAKWIAVVVVILIISGVNSLRVDSNFATQARVKFDYIGKPIDTIITDPDDLKALKEILCGWKHWDGDFPACGYGENVSVTLTDGRRRVTFCPACDGCESFRIGNSPWYLDVSKEQRRKFEAIVRKYGMTFPCV